MSDRDRVLFAAEEEIIHRLQGRPKDRFTVHQLYDGLSCVAKEQLAQARPQLPDHISQVLGNVVSRGHGRWVRKPWWAFWQRYKLALQFREARR